MGQGSWIKVHGSRFMDQGSWIMFMEIICKEIVKVLVQVGYLIIFSNVDTVLI